jgi:hypothetical protein
MGFSSKQLGGAIGAAVVVLIAGCGQNADSPAYRDGYNTGNQADWEKRYYYPNGPTPAQNCEGYRQQAKLAGENQDFADDFYDGCIAGVKDLLGKDAFDRANKGQLAGS